MLVVSPLLALIAGEETKEIAVKHSDKACSSYPEEVCILKLLMKFLVVLVAVAVKAINLTVSGMMLRISLM